MKLSDFNVLLDIRDLLNNLDNRYFDKQGEWSTPEGQQIKDTIASIEVLLDKIRNEVENGNIEDDRPVATVTDIVEILNNTTNYEWKGGE